MESVGASRQEPFSCSRFLWQLFDQSGCSGTPVCRKTKSCPGGGLGRCSPASSQGISITADRPEPWLNLPGCAVYGTRGKVCETTTPPQVFPGIVKLFWQHNPLGGHAASSAGREGLQMFLLCLGLPCSTAAVCTRRSSGDEGPQAPHLSAAAAAETQRATLHSLK